MTLEFGYAIFSNVSNVCLRSRISFVPMTMYIIIRTVISIKAIIPILV